MSKANFFANAGGEAARSAEETRRLARSEPCEMCDMSFLQLGVGTDEIVGTAPGFLGWREQCFGAECPRRLGLA
jgi:hypothetical protein